MESELLKTEMKEFKKTHKLVVKLL